MATGGSFFWDSNVFYRFLSGTPPEYVRDINQFVRDAQAGDVEILCSTLAFAEIRPSALKRAGHGSIDEFFQDVKGVFKPINPTPDIFKSVAILKDWKYLHAEKEPRYIGTADAIQLVTCLYAKEVLGIRDIVFHTFDDGKSKVMGERSVSLLNFQDWLVGCNGTLQDRIAALPRRIPMHPSPDLV